MNANITKRDDSNTEKIIYPTLLDISALREQALNSNFTQCVIVGYQGSGKTTTAYYIAKELQKHDKFIVIHFKALAVNTMQLLAIKEKYNTDNVIVILDDMSYITSIMSQKQASIFKNFIATIRHIFTSKIVLLTITHVEKGIPPLLRNSDNWIYMTLTRESDIRVKGSNINRHALYALFEELREKGRVEKGDKIITLPPNSRPCLALMGRNIKINRVDYVDVSELHNYELIEKFVNIEDMNKEDQEQDQEQ
ncbi:MAG: AAA family ATPase [Candidatus Nitrosocaldaceae archaeon]